MHLYLRSNARQVQSWGKDSKCKNSKTESCFFKLERKMAGLRSAEVVSEKSTINVV